MNISKSEQNVLNFGIKVLYFGIMHAIMIMEIENSGDLQERQLLQILQVGSAPTHEFSHRR